MALWLGTIVGADAAPVYPVPVHLLALPPHAELAGGARLEVFVEIPGWLLVLGGGVAGWVEAARVLRDVSTPTRTAPQPSRLVDFRATASKKHDYGHRSWAAVTGICLHQTACRLGEKPARWSGVGCHLGLTQAGQAIWLHDWDRLIVHGNGWNAGTVGIEMDGLYAGIEGDHKTVWDDPSTKPRERATTPTPALIDAALVACRWICAEVAAHGGRIKALVAHRQASPTRRNDPGSYIWQHVALPLHAELGLSDGGPGFHLGDGLPIPEAWDKSREGIRY